MYNASMSVYPLEQALINKLSDLESELYRARYWAITPVFIPSAAEFGVNYWTTTDKDATDVNELKKHRIKTINEPLNS
jgi:hypothetical protein